MDAVSKRGMWKTLAEVTEQRSILLTVRYSLFTDLADLDHCPHRADHNVRIFLDIISRIYVGLR